jgi:hypothetical protein
MYLTREQIAFLASLGDHVMTSYTVYRGTPAVRIDVPNCRYIIGQRGNILTAKGI